MAETDPRLQEQLRRLDEELDEGDITKKGYEKRRTLILSQYIAPQNAPSTPRMTAIILPPKTALALPRSLL
jgi:hypothetical protein